MKIPRNRFLEMNEDVYVEALYPNTQVDIFRYKEPLSRGDAYDSIGYLVSTIFDGELFYEYNTIKIYQHIDESNLIEQLQDNIKLAVIRTL